MQEVNDSLQGLWHDVYTGTGMAASQACVAGKLTAESLQISTSLLFERKQDRRLLQEGLITTALVSLTIEHSMAV